MRTAFLVVALGCFAVGAAFLALAAFQEWGPVAIRGNIIAAEGEAGNTAEVGLCAWVLGALLWVVRAAGSGRIRPLK